MINPFQTFKQRLLKLNKNCNFIFVQQQSEILTSQIGSMLVQSLGDLPYTLAPFLTNSYFFKTIGLDEH